MLYVLLYGCVFFVGSVVLSFCFCCPSLCFILLFGASFPLVTWVNLCVSFVKRELVSVQKAGTIRVYNTCSFYQKGRRYVCFMLSYCDFYCDLYRDAVGVAYSYHIYPCIKLTATKAILVYTHRVMVA